MQQRQRSQCLSSFPSVAERGEGDSKTVCSEKVTVRWYWCMLKCSSAAVAAAQRGLPQLITNTLNIHLQAETDH